METTLNMYVIRHGVSQTQELQKTGIFGKLVHIFFRDPSLSDAGKQESKSKGLWLQRMQSLKIEKQPSINKGILKLDYSNTNALPQTFNYIICSDLLRAIETSCLMFPNRKIYVFPYISEIYGLLNIYPHKKDYQKKIIDQKFPNNNVDWSFYDGYMLPNYEKFIIKLKEFCESKHIKSSNIALVTHSLYMMKHIIHNNECFWRLNNKPSNNSIYHYKINI